MHQVIKAASALALVLGTIAAPAVFAQTGGPTLTYPLVADIIDPVTEQFGLYFSAAIKFSLLAVAGFVAWRYIKKTANKV